MLSSLPVRSTACVSAGVVVGGGTCVGAGVDDGVGGTGVGGGIGVGAGAGVSIGGGTCVGADGIGKRVGIDLDTELATGRRAGESSFALVCFVLRAVRRLLHLWS